MLKRLFSGKLVLYENSLFFLFYSSGCFEKFYEFITFVSSKVSTVSNFLPETTHIVENQSTSTAPNATTERKDIKKKKDTSL